MGPSWEYSEGLGFESRLDHRFFPWIYFSVLSFTVNNIKPKYLVKFEETNRML